MKYYTFLQQVSIRNKLKIVVLFTSGLMLLLSMIAFISQELINFRRNMSTELISLGQFIAVNSQTALATQQYHLMQRHLYSLQQMPNVLVAALLNAQGDLLAYYQRPDAQQETVIPSLSIPDFTQTNNKQDDAIIAQGRLNVWVPIWEAQQLIGIVYIAADLRQFYERSIRLIAIMVAVLIIALIFAFMLATQLQKRITQPIYLLLNTMRQVAKTRNYSLRCEQTSQDELGLLVMGFNDMLAQIEQRDMRYENLAANLAGIIFQLKRHLNGQFELLYISPGSLNLYGFSPWQLQQQPSLLLQPVIEQDRYTLLRSLIVAAKKRSQWYCSWRIVQNKKTYWLQGYGRLNQSKLGDLIWDGLITDITELKQTEATLSQKNQALHCTLQQLQQAQQELIQAEKMAVLGQLMASVAHEINTPLGAIRSSAQTIDRILSEVLPQFLDWWQQLDKPQQQAWLQCLNQPNHRLLTNLRAQRQTRRQLQQALTEAGLTSAALLADRLVDMGLTQLEPSVYCLFQHENSLKNIEMLHQWSSLQRSTHTIIEATNQAAKVIFALKSYSSQSTHEIMQLVDINKTLETVLTLYQNAFKCGVRLVCQFSAVPPVYGHENELIQVWTNLLHNALQAMAYRGTLTIQLDSDENGIQVYFHDTGCGIDEATQTRIFEPFFTTKPAGEGCGLGLDIVQKIITRHQGRIAVQSQPHDTCFTVWLPCAN